MKATRRQFLLLAGGATVSAFAAPRLLRLGAGAAQAQAIPGAPSFKGAAGTSIQGPVTLNAGLAVLRAQHNGTDNFEATLFLPQPTSSGETLQQIVDHLDYIDFSQPFDEVGALKEGAAVLIGTPGDHYMAVLSSGAFQISVEQPLPENVTTVQQTTFSGKGKDVTPYFTLPAGLSSLSVQTTGPLLRSWLYHLDDLGGEPITDGLNVYDGRFFDFSFPSNQSSYPVSLPDAGPYLLVTDNIGLSDTWTYTFQ